MVEADRIRGRAIILAHSAVIVLAQGLVALDVRLLMEHVHGSPALACAALRGDDHTVRVRVAGLVLRGDGDRLKAQRACQGQQDGRHGHQRRHEPFHRRCYLRLEAAGTAGFA